MYDNSDDPETQRLYALRGKLTEVTGKYETLLAQRDELAEALRDAEFLLRKLAINPLEARFMTDSCIRSANDASSILAKLSD